MRTFRERRSTASPSDDLFSLQDPPGKTLIVGASYVALECAGFLTSFGFDTTVMVRSILLRGFDQQMAENIGAYMAKHGTKFIRPCVPASVEKLESGKLKVTYSHNGVSESDEFDTVMLAIGREPETRKIGLDKAGVTLNSAGKIPTTHERTNVPHIYAIGDVILDVPSKLGLELTPVAIKAGVLLAKRLYGGSTIPMNYKFVPTTIFTPLEYGAIGFSEEDAVAKFGADNVEVYHTFYKPLEWTVAEREDNTCYLKVVCNKADNERVIGYHVLGPNAGEVTQGFGVAIRCGATKQDFDLTVGIHPTCGEEATTMNVTKSSGESAEKTGC